MNVRSAVKRFATALLTVFVSCTAFVVIRATESVAHSFVNPALCALCVEDSSGIALQMGGTSSVDTEKGGVTVVSVGNPAVSLSGNAELHSEGPINLAGSARLQSNASTSKPLNQRVNGLNITDPYPNSVGVPQLSPNRSTIDFSSTNGTAVPKRADGAYRDVTIAGNGSTSLPVGHAYRDVSVSGTVKATLQPGTYRSLNISGSSGVTLNAGRYIFTGSFSLSGSSKVVGSNVELVFACDLNGVPQFCDERKPGASFSTKGSATLKLAGSGSAAGSSITFLGKNSATWTVEGSSKTELTDSGIDAPSGALAVLGTAEVKTGGPIHVGSLTLNGSSQLEIDLENASVPHATSTTTTTTTTTTRPASTTTTTIRVTTTGSVTTKVTTTTVTTTTKPSTTSTTTVVIVTTTPTGSTTTTKSPTSSTTTTGPATTTTTGPATTTTSGTTTTTSTTTTTLGSTTTTALPSTTTTLPATFQVRPLTECREVRANGSEWAWFGFENEWTDRIDIAVSPRNMISPLPIDRGQPAAFAPGRATKVFAVEITQPAGVTWTVESPNTTRRTATANGDTPLCTPATTTTTTAPQVEVSGPTFGNSSLLPTNAAFDELCPDGAIVGTSGPDVLRGTDGEDVICGLGGDDQIFGLGADDILIGGSGADQIEGGSGNDSIHGGSGSDRILGEQGSDSITGNSGDDILLGGSDRDEIDGGEGIDTADGGDNAFDFCIRNEQEANCENIRIEKPGGSGVVTASVEGIDLEVRGAGLSPKHLIAASVAAPRQFASTSVGSTLSAELIGGLTFSKATATFTIRPGVDINSVSVVSERNGYIEYDPILKRDSLNRKVTVALRHFSLHTPVNNQSFLDASSLAANLADIKPRCIKLGPSVYHDVVLDASGSFDYVKNASAKRAAELLINAAPTVSGRQASSFSDSAIRQPSRRDFAVTDLRRDWISGSFGSSDLVQALQDARVAAVKRSEPIRVVSVVTDYAALESANQVNLAWEIGAYKVTGVILNLLVSDANNRFVTDLSLVWNTGGFGFVKHPADIVASAQFVANELFDSGKNSDKDLITDCEELAGPLLYADGKITVGKKLLPAESDSDKDGLHDSEEYRPLLAGNFRLAEVRTGRIIYTEYSDPRNLDTDGDNTLDVFEERTDQSPRVAEPRLTGFQFLLDEEIAAAGITRNDLKSRINAIAKYTKSDSVWRPEYEQASLGGLYGLTMLMSLAGRDFAGEKFSGVSKSDLAENWSEVTKQAQRDWFFSSRETQDFFEFALANVGPWYSKLSQLDTVKKVLTYVLVTSIAAVFAVVMLVALVQGAVAATLLLSGGTTLTGASVFFSVAGTAVAIPAKVFFVTLLTVEVGAIVVGGGEAVAEFNFSLGLALRGMNTQVVDDLGREAARKAPLAVPQDEDIVSLKPGVSEVETPPLAPDTSEQLPLINANTGERIRPISFEEGAARQAVALLRKTDGRELKPILQPQIDELPVAQQAEAQAVGDVYAEGAGKSSFQYFLRNIGSPTTDPGENNYPANNGADYGTEKMKRFAVDEEFDRFGFPFGGTFIGRKNDTFAERALPLKNLAPVSYNPPEESPNFTDSKYWVNGQQNIVSTAKDSDGNDMLGPYAIYRTVKPFWGVSGKISPAFFQEGGGEQYVTAVSLEKLLLGGLIKLVYVGPPPQSLLTPITPPVQGGFGNGWISLVPNKTTTTTTLAR